MATVSGSSGNRAKSAVQKVANHTPTVSEKGMGKGGTPRGGLATGLGRVKLGGTKRLPKPSYSK